MTLKAIITRLLLCSFYLLPAHADESLPIVFITGEWPPYTSAHINNGGLITEIVSATINEMDIDAKLSFVPWERGEKMLKNGEAFGFFPYAITPERKKNFVFSERLLINPSGKFFYKTSKLKSVPEIKTWEDFKPYKFAVLAGDASVEVMSQIGIEMERVISDDLNVHRLYKERVDFVQMDPVLGWYLIEQLYPGETHLFSTLDITFQELIGESGNPDWDSYLMVSPDYPNASELLKSFNESLERIKANGEYDEILTRYALN
ncbi:substrate-binding periplasmic protein [Vibrio sp. TRT 17S01]|uniref:substrate-binding periplasmic protein n=1 Tax=Vibrio sp. TRT 17S01 TaxID=3418505 RepID=UPI003CF9CD98